MDIYLVQHGEAVPESVDPARPLSARGRDDVARVARAVGRMGLPVSVIYHSGKPRALQTAGILADAIHPTGGVIETGGLSPNDDPAAAAALAGRLREPAMLVGHLPHLSRLSSLLITGDAAQEVVAFRMGAVVCLSGEGGLWRLRWIVTPETAA